MNHSSLFHPTIPVQVRRPPRGHLADGEAEAQPQMGPNGFTTHYRTAITMVGKHVTAELLEDKTCELVLGTGQTLLGHFYASPDASTDRTLFVFIPAGA